MRAIPPEFRVPNEDPSRSSCRPISGWTKNRWKPKLVEIQGFPSLYAYQPVLAATYREAYGWTIDLQALLDRPDAGQVSRAAAAARLWPITIRRTWCCWRSIRGSRRPCADFLLTERAVAAYALVDITRCAQSRATSCSTRATARACRFERIYNRAIVDELVSASRSSWPSIFATIWMWSGPGIRTGFSGSASFRCRI